MRLMFRAIAEAVPGPKWKAEYERLAPAYQRWFLREGDAARPAYLHCERALRQHMPELLATYERLVELAGGGDQAARLLSLYRPTPYLTGCSQAIWTRGEPLLVRNYDYSPRLWDATLWCTCWNGRRVIAMGDCLWGALDGINEAGVCVSLAFGGSRAIGVGFGIPLVLRYILEFCATTREAVAVLTRVPSHMAYNVTVLDAQADYATVFVGPDQHAVVTRRRVATNHQGAVQWWQFAHATASLDRERFLAARAADEDETPERLVRRFREPPVYSSSFAHGWGTLYTAVYSPGPRGCGYWWPAGAECASIDSFSERAYELAYPDE